MSMGRDDEIPGSALNDGAPLHPHGPTVGSGPGRGGFPQGKPPGQAILDHYLTPERREAIAAGVEGIKSVVGGALTLSTMARVLAAVEAHIRRMTGTETPIDWNMVPEWFTMHAGLVEEWRASHIGEARRAELQAGLQAESDAAIADLLESATEHTRKLREQMGADTRLRAAVGAFLNELRASPAGHPVDVFDVTQWALTDKSGAAAQELVLAYRAAVGERGDGKTGPGCVYLVTTGDGEDGNEWHIVSIHGTRESAERAKAAYDTHEIKRPDGSTYTLRSNDVEEWELTT